MLTISWNNFKPVDQIRKDLSVLADQWVVIYGSYVRRELNARSDIDVALVTRAKHREDALLIQNSLIGKFPSPYDIKVFELLPLSIKARVMEQYIVLFGEPLEISEYFYYWRKLWRDQEKRYRENQFSSLREIREGINRRKMLLSRLKLANKKTRE